MPDYANLHPVWRRHFGLESPAPNPAPRPPTTLVAALRARAADRWEVTNGASLVAGQPANVRRQLGPHTFVSAVVFPGDPRYPYPHRPNPHL